MFTLYNTGADPNIAGGNQYADGGLAVARGQAIFNTRKITITGVSGLNDELGAASIEGTQDCGLRIADWGQS